MILSKAEDECYLNLVVPLLDSKISTLGSLPYVHKNIHKDFCCSSVFSSV